MNDSTTTHPPMLPPLEECLFGASRRCPKVGRGLVSPLPSTTGNSKQQSKSPSLGRFLEQQGPLCSANQNNTDDTEQHTLAEETAVSESYDSIMDNSRWGAVAAQHDISMPQLRKLCSQGIPDEGSWRGVA